MVPPLAFSVAGYTELEVLNQFLEELKRAIEEGTTIGTIPGKHGPFPGGEGL
ncbi:MAG: hypothetical protein ACLTW9_02360 [Enterocloster sp.]